MDGAISQEFYRWPLTTQAAKNALDMRYRLIDYLYTAFHQANSDGTPVLRPLWYSFPNDPNTFAIDSQFLFGPSVLVSPVIDENATSVDVYYPDELVYDFHTFAVTSSAAGTTTLNDVNFTSIPVSVVGGAVLPLRVNGTMTTTELRKTDFELVVLPARDGSASGSLYFDDGESITPKSSTLVEFAYKNGKLTVEGHFGYGIGVNVARVRFGDMKRAVRGAKMNGKAVSAKKVSFDEDAGVGDVSLGIPFTSGFTVELV